MNSISKTRSGKLYGVQVEHEKIKSKRCCSYCWKPGHNISKCKDPKLDELEKKAREASIFGDCIVDGTSKFLKVWLKTLTNIELRALGYKFYSIENFKLKYNSGIETYIKNLALEFSLDEVPWPLPEKLNNISEETFCEFYELLLANTHEIWHDYFKQIIIIHRPSARRFDIEANFNSRKKSKDSSCPICLSDKIKCKNIVTTNCNHEFCGDCFGNYLQSVKADITKTPTCAYCRDKITTIDVKDKVLEKRYKNEFCRAPLARVEDPILTPNGTFMHSSQSQSQSHSHSQNENPNENSNLNMLISVVYHFVQFIPA
uniref:RING-type domain-containing protein n=1 Tax=viral metagenome TaxID=1070528 RepID=A0A6C0DTI6_9ZZZZ